MSLTAPEEPEIDETLDESFPASDPPAWTLGRECHEVAPARHTASATVEARGLTRRGLWDAVVAGLSDGGTALPGITSCHVTRRAPSGEELEREVVLWGETLQEIVRFAAPAVAYVERHHPEGCSEIMTLGVEVGDGGEPRLTCTCQVSDQGDGAAAPKADGLQATVEAVCEATLDLARGTMSGA